MTRTSAAELEFAPILVLAGCEYQHAHPVRGGLVKIGNCFLGQIGISSHAI
ncbi:hypothetical protein N9047_01300 [bacterium]|nr:hypothetical protein [bacterium]